MPESTIRRLLEDLRGGGFNTSLVINGIQFSGQKVVSFENNTVFTVDSNGVARATPIVRIDSVDF